MTAGTPALMNSTIFEKRMSDAFIRS
jgi:hypothetical protein